MDRKWQKFTLSKQSQTGKGDGGHSPNTKMFFLVRLPRLGGHGPQIFQHFEEKLPLIEGGYFV